MKKQISIITALLLAAIAGAEQMREYEKPNAVEVPELQNVKIKGPIGEKMNTFFQNRIFSDCGKYEVFAEAERAFTNPQDDAKKAVGVWQGEFWGKLAISASRVYDYSQNPELKKFLRAAHNGLPTGRRLYRQLSKQTLFEGDRSRSRKKSDELEMQLVLESLVQKIYAMGHARSLQNNKR